MYPAPAWPPQATGGTFLFGSIWAVSTVNDLNIRSGPGTNNASIGQLDIGDLVLVLEGGEAPGSWAHVATDGVLGYVNTGPTENPWLKSTPTPWKSYYTKLVGVASNGSSYIAFGNNEALDYSPYEGGQGPLMRLSSDGVNWTTPSTLPYGEVTDVAGGPGGWVALSNGYPDVLLATFSADGQTWGQGQALGGSAVAYGPAGWVVLSGNEARRSTDGRSWSDPVTLGEVDRIESSDAGYVAFLRGSASADGMWASANGATWVQVDLADDGAWIADVELVGSKVLVALRERAGTEEVDGRSFLQRGTLAATGVVTWNASAPSFDEGALVDSVSQGPGGLLALGWDVKGLIPALWRSADGASWQRLSATSDTLGGSVGPEPAWGAGGWIGLGTAADGVGQQLWRSADGGSWSATGDQVELRARPPCPPNDQVSTLVLIYLGPFAEACFGDSSLTVRGWVPLVEGLGGCCYPISEPGWLNGAYPGGWLMSGEADAWWTSLNIYIPPGVDGTRLQPKTWVEVVGHFRDPAAASCRSSPLALFVPQTLVSQAGVRRDCQQRFVVESITAVAGP